MKKLAYVTIEDWMANELARFEGDNAIDEAISYKEDLCDSYALEQSTVLIEGGKLVHYPNIYSERYEDQAEDLYIIGYNEGGDELPIELG